MKPWVSISSPSKLGVMSALPVLKRWRQEDLESKDSLSSVAWEASWGSMKPSLEKIEEGHRPSEADPHCQLDRIYSRCGGVPPTVSKNRPSLNVYNTIILWAGGSERIKRRR